MASKTQIQQLNNNNQLETLHPETDADIVTVDNSSGHYGGSATNVQAALEELFGKNDYGYVEISSASGDLTDAQYAECLKDFAVIKDGSRLYIKEFSHSTLMKFSYKETENNASGITMNEYICYVEDDKSYEVHSSSRTVYLSSQTDTLLSGKQSKFTDGSATIASESGDVVTIKAGITQTNGAISNSSGTSIELGTAAKKNTGTGAGNVPILDANGKLNESVLPALAITDTFTVASQSAMLGLTAQVGDIAIRTDLNKCFILKTAGASTLANWAELKTPTDVVQSVNGKTGAVTLESGDIKYYSAASTKTVKEMIMSLSTSVSALQYKVPATVNANAIVYVDGNGDVVTQRIDTNTLPGYIYAYFEDEPNPSNDEETISVLKIAKHSTINADYIGNLPASKITSGTFDAGRIPNLAASKITSGTFADARIASASTWNAKYTKPSGGIPSSDLADSGVTAGTYSAVQVNAKGLVTGGAQFIEVGTTGQTTPSASLAVGGLFFKKI